MADGPPSGTTARPALSIWALLLALVSLAIPTWRFGRGFLLQFFVSPFQFFILGPWLVALFSVWSGVMPMKSGPRLRRSDDPVLFRRNVRFCFLAGAAAFAMNLCISWQVMARHR